MADFTCKEEGCGFVSAGWKTKKQADERGKQHMEEHATGEAMPELAEFEGRD